MSKVAIVLVCVLIVQVSASDDEIVEEASNYRLPNNTIPKHYDIKFWTNGHVGNLSYQGSVKILFDVVEPTNQVILHSNNLTIKQCSLIRFDEIGDRIELNELEVKNNTEMEQLIISSNDLLEKGSHLVHIEFNGTLNSTYPTGMFLTSYRDETDTERYVVASHFEPIMARKAFPCFDEPALKGTFNLSIVHHKSHEAYSNMPATGRELIDEEFVETTFQQTPKMSTYLLTYCVSDLAVKTVGDSTAIGRKSILEKSTTSLQISHDILEALEKYTNLSYSDYMPKLDHLLVPSNKSTNIKAMENWGLIMYFEESLVELPDYYDLFVNIAKSIPSAQMIAHELVHQWFGNLVTPQWWNHLWLKEGFATLVSDYILHVVRPTERWMDRFTVFQTTTGLADYNSVRAMSSECNNNENIMLQYGTWSYHKAGTVLNMFQKVLGDEKWQSVVRMFLKNHLLDTVTPQDLYSAIDSVSEGSGIFPPNVSIEAIFNSWIQEGTPMLYVHRLEGGSKIILYQERQELCTDSGQDPRIIPVNYAYQSAPNFEETEPIQWLTSEVALISTNASYDEWIVFNKQRFGAYKIVYEEHNWRLIARALRENATCIHFLNRAQLLDDAISSNKAGKLDIRVVYDLLTYLRNESDLLVWSRAKDILINMRRTVQWDENYELFKIFQNHLIEQIYGSFHPQMELLSFERSIHRWITNMACIGGIKRCLEAARTTFSNVVKTNSTIDPEEIYTVYCFGLQNATEDEFSWLLNRFRSTRDLKEQTLLVSVLLRCSENVDKMRHSIFTVKELLDDYEKRHKNVEMLFDDFPSNNRIIGEKHQQIVEILNADGIMKNLGHSFTKTLLREMAVLTKTKEQMNQSVELLEKFNETFKDEKPVRLNIFKEKEPTFDSLMLVDFLQNYVPKINNV